MAQSYRYCRVEPSCGAGFVANRLAGAPVYSLPGGRSIVPLLHPQQHGLPFALLLELHAVQPTCAAQQPITQLDRSIYTFHYILAGSGQLVRAGAQEQLQAGDAVIMHSGAATCFASGGAVTPMLDQVGDDPAHQSPPWQLAELVAYMPHQLFERQQTAEQQQQQLDQAAEHAASLQPLVSLDSGVAGRLPDRVTQQLLAGAKETARKVLLRDVPSSGMAQDRQTASSAAGSRRDSHGDSTHRERLGWLSKAVGAATATLTAWWQQQQRRTCPVTKRTLAELTAFRLPNQSNRLAVQFDPLSYPQVPFVSGLEIFERGHCTQPHVHPTAHELFFILAGEGTAFCGPPGPDQHRFPVRAGDVVVFRPGAVHGIDNSSTSRMYCLELMVPNEQFAEFVRAGTDTGHLADDDLCVLAAIGCR